MKLPEYVVIKGEVWAIKIIDMSNMLTYDDKGCVTGHAVGLCEAGTKTLYFHDKLSKELRKSTFLHELGHAIFTEMGMNQTSFSSDTEELIVENYANVLCKVLRSLNLTKPLLVEEDKPKKKKKKT